MIVVSKINYVAEDLGLEIYMDSGIMIKIWSDSDDDSRKVFNDFTARLKASITNGLSVIDIDGELNVRVRLSNEY